MTLSLFLLSISYFFSRLLFLRSYPVFYDSFEYQKIAEAIKLSNFLQVIASSHQPIHTFYFLTILIFKQIFFFLSPDKILIFISLTFGYLTIIYFFLFAKNYLDNEKADPQTQKAFFASLLLLLFPYFFIINTNIFYEGELLFFQIFALYFFNKSLKQDQNVLQFIVFLSLAGLLFGFSISIFIGSLFILPIFILIFWQHRKLKKFSFLILFFLISFFLPLLIDFLVFQSPQLVLAKYQLHFGDITSSQGGLLIFVFRFLRNIVLESSAILSWPGVITIAAVLLISIFHLLPSASAFNLLSLIVWFGPPIILMQFWHAGLFGRLAIFLIFPAALLLAEFITKKWQKIFLLVLLILLIPYLLAQTKKPPIYKYYELIKNLPDLALLTSDSNRFLYQKHHLPLFVFSPGNDLLEAEKFINKNLEQGKIVLIDSAGLSYPYFQFDGDFYHLLSRYPKSPPHIQLLLQKFNLEPFKTDSKNKRIYFKRVTRK